MKLDRKLLQPNLDVVPLRRRIGLAGLGSVLATVLLATATVAVAQQSATEEPAETEEMMKPAEEGEAGTEAPETQINTATGGLPDEETPAEAPVQGQLVEQPEGTFLTSTILGASVVDRDGETVGKVADLVIGENNAVSGIVVSIGGFLGLGESDIAFDFSEVKLVQSDEGASEVWLSVASEQLEQAPEFVTIEEKRRAEEVQAAQREVDSAADTEATDQPTE